MDEKGTASGNVIKVALVCVGIVIVLLIVIKQLNLNPSEVTAGTVGVKFQHLAPPQEQVPRTATAELEKKVQELQDRLNSSTTSPIPSASTARGEIQSTPVNIAGYWQANPYRQDPHRPGAWVGSLSAGTSGAVHHGGSAGA